MIFSMEFISEIQIDIEFQFLWYLAFCIETHFLSGVR